MLQRKLFKIRTVTVIQLPYDLFQRRCIESFVLFYKILKNKSPGYLFNLISARITHYLLKNSDNIPCLNTKHNFSKKFFFLSTTIEWNILDVNLRKCDSYNVSKKTNKRPSSNSFYSCFNVIGIKNIPRIQIGLSHLQEHIHKQFP